MSRFTALKSLAIPLSLVVVLLAPAVLAGPASAAAPPLQFVTLGASSEVKGAPANPKGTAPTTALQPIVAVPNAPLGQGYDGEVEPNGTPATATPLAGSNLVVRANLFPNGDVDFFSFSASAGDFVYAAVMTAFSSGNSTDSQLTLLDTNGTTVIEFDDDDGSFTTFSSSIAGAAIPATGTYFLKVNDFTAGTTSQRPYELHFRLQTGAPTPEVESNDTPATANPLPANGWVSGTRNPAAATEQDWFSLTLAAGDTVFLSLDMNPERDAVEWNGRLGFALFGDASNQILVVDGPGGGDVTDAIDSEALFFTVKTAGTYYAFVDSASAAVGGPTATYTLSVSVHPATDEGVNCTTYTSTDVPKAIGPGAGLVSSTITVPGNPRIADVDVDIVLNHALMADIDAHLRSPAGNDNGLFTDIGATATGGQNQMDIVFDDEAAIPPSFTVLKGLRSKPESGSTSGTANGSGAYRLSWFDGENAGGVWTLDLRDDTTNASGGTLTSWSLRICEPPPPPACPMGFSPTTVFATDFEAGAAGFTHSGTQDEWELGLPATVATTTANPVAGFSTCNSGVNCWKTDLDNTYNASSNQDLLSPNINLAGLSPPVVVTWAQRHQVETANFDHWFVEVREVGMPANAVRLYDWLEPTMISASTGTGNPQVNIGGSAGWGVFSRRADSLAGLNTELRVHLDSDSSINFAGVAIDDVSVTACAASSADLSITKTDGVATATPGTSVTYTITASNAGPDPVTGASVTDTFSASHAGCTWTCVGAGGGTCTAAGAGNIGDTVNLPVGGSVTYTATCGITFGATGTLVNTATVSSAVGDPTPGNNSATDTDTLTPMADLSITKTDGVTTATPGGSVTYTITATNAGPSNAVSSTVADTFPASLTCTWTCTGAGGTCTAAGAGNINDSVSLPAGASVTYTASCAISAGATGMLSNTATVSSATPDPTPGNNSATDTDTLTPMADLAITKTDGVTTATPGGSVTYTIVASNAGPSDATGADRGRHLPGLADLHLDLRGRRRRHLHGGGCRQHQRRRQPAGRRQRHLHRQLHHLGRGLRLAGQHRDGGGPRRGHRSGPGQQLGHRHRHPDGRRQRGERLGHQDGRRGQHRRRYRDLHRDAEQRRPRDAGRQPGRRIHRRAAGGPGPGLGLGHQRHRGGQHRHQHGHLERLDPVRRLGDHHHHRDDPAQRRRQGGVEPGQLRLRRRRRRHQRVPGGDRRPGRRREHGPDHHHGGGRTLRVGDPHPVGGGPGRHGAAAGRGSGGPAAPAAARHRHPGGVTPPPAPTRLASPPWDRAGRPGGRGAARRAAPPPGAPPGRRRRSAGRWR